jgi:hypothetical protein
VAPVVFIAEEVPLLPVPDTINEVLATSAGCPKEAIVSVRVALPVPNEFVAPNVTMEVPVAVGVPEMSPVEEFTLRPPGRPVVEKLVGELEAVIWYENVDPTVPPDVVALVIAGGEARGAKRNSVKPPSARWGFIKRGLTFMGITALL